MASNDHNETFDNLTITNSVTDPSGTAHTGELADLADTGASGSASVSDDGATVLSSADDLNFGSFLDVADDGDGTVTIDAQNTDTNTHVNVENVDGTTLVQNPSALTAGPHLVFSDDGDGSATIDTRNVVGSTDAGTIYITDTKPSSPSKGDIWIHTNTSL